MKQTEKCCMALRIMIMAQDLVRLKILMHMLMIFFNRIVNVINHHLQLCYNFDKNENMYKYYLPNLIRHHGYVNCDQVPHLDFKHIIKEYKPKTFKVRKKRKLN